MERKKGRERGKECRGELPQVQSNGNINLKMDTYLNRLIIGRTKSPNVRSKQ